MCNLQLFQASLIFESEATGKGPLDKVPGFGAIMYDCK